LFAATTSPLAKNPLTAMTAAMLIANKHVNHFNLRFTVAPREVNLVGYTAAVRAFRRQMTFRLTPS
jgi:hypothetical protein